MVRAGLGWLLLLLAAILNGAIREALFSPAWGGPAAHVASTILLCGFILGLGWWLLPWLAPGSRGAAWRVGGGWLLLTVAFEFLGGHFLFGAPWSKLLADYDLTRGRIWILVLVVTALTPPVVYRLRR